MIIFKGALHRSVICAWLELSKIVEKMTSSGFPWLGCEDYRFGGVECERHGHFPDMEGIDAIICIMGSVGTTFYYPNKCQPA